MKEILEDLKNKLEELKTEISNLRLQRKNLNLNRKGVRNLANSLSLELEDKGFEVGDTTFFGYLTSDQTRDEFVAQDLFHLFFIDPVSNEEYALVLREWVKDTNIFQVAFRIQPDPEIFSEKVLAEEEFKPREFTDLQRNDLENLITNLLEKSDLSTI